MKRVDIVSDIVRIKQKKGEVVTQDQIDFMLMCTTKKSLKRVLDDLYNKMDMYDYICDVLDIKE